MKHIDIKKILEENPDIYESIIVISKEAKRLNRIIDKPESQTEVLNRAIDNFIGGSVPYTVDELTSESAQNAYYWRMKHVSAFSEAESDGEEEMAEDGIIGEVEVEALKGFNRKVAIGKRDKDIGMDLKKGPGDSTGKAAEKGGDGGPVLPWTIKTDEEDEDEEDGTPIEEIAGEVEPEMDETGKDASPDEVAKEKTKKAKSTAKKTKTGEDASPDEVAKEKTKKAKSRVKKAKTGEDASPDEVAEKKPKKAKSTAKKTKTAKKT